MGLQKRWGIIQESRLSNLKERQYAYETSSSQIGFILNILFICTHNRCRSIICEAIANQMSDGRLRAFSAGSQPAGEVHPLSLKYLENRAYTTNGLISESWNSYADKNIDLAVTVCDSAASESCPLWMGKATKAHWGLSDPSKVEGTEAEIEIAFLQLMDKVESRIQKLLALDLEHLSSGELQQVMTQIAEES